MVCLNLFENFKKIDMYRGFSLNIYNILLMILASLISGLGLLYNNTPAILGSMLISPLGSPIVANIIYLLTKQGIKMKYFYTSSIFNLQFIIFSLIPIL